MLHITRFRAAAFCGAVSMLFFVSSAGAQNLLSNGNLDAVTVTTQLGATPTGWSATSSKAVEGPFNDGLSSENFANVLDPGGFGVFFKPFQGTLTDKVSASLVSPPTAATAGLPYKMTGWAGAEANYIGLTDPTVGSQFHLKFFNGSTLLSDIPLDLVTAGLGVGAPTPPATGFNYHPFSITATAPVGTNNARVEADMINAYGNPAGGGQAFVVDAFSLTVPEPASLGVLAIGALGLVSRRRSAR